MPNLKIDVANQQRIVPIDVRRLVRAVRDVLREAGVVGGVVSIAVVDDATIRGLNTKYLAHDFATDVLSFVLEKHEGYLEGEIIISSETAEAAARRFSSNAADELLLYAIHGALHLVGYRDDTRAAKAEMRRKEADYMGRFSRPVTKEPISARDRARPTMGFGRRHARPSLVPKD